MSQRSRPSSADRTRDMPNSKQLAVTPFQEQHLQQGELSFQPYSGQYVQKACQQASTQFSFGELSRQPVQQMQVLQQHRQNHRRHNRQERFNKYSQVVQNQHKKQQHRSYHQPHRQQSKQRYPQPTSQRAPHQLPQQPIPRIPYHTQPFLLPTQPLQHPPSIQVAAGKPLALESESQFHSGPEVTALLFQPSMSTRTTSFIQVDEAHPPHEVEDITFFTNAGTQINMFTKTSGTVVTSLTDRHNRQYRLSAGRQFRFEGGFVYQEYRGTPDGNSGVDVTRLLSGKNWRFRGLKVRNEIDGLGRRRCGFMDVWERMDGRIGVAFRKGWIGDDGVIHTDGPI